MNGAEQQRKPHILVIEDNPADVELLRRALGNAGLDCELTVIDDGADALSFVRRSVTSSGDLGVDLAIVDLNLPKHSGLEIVEEMRAHELFSGLPVVILTSSSAPRDRAVLERFHIARYIVKPPDLDEFLKIGYQVKEILVESKRPERLLPT
jgi:chemotaxis family two-component system response regulator Rcp1